MESVCIFEQSNINKEILKSKQIHEESFALNRAWLEDDFIDVPRHLHLMFKLANQLEKIVKGNSLNQVWTYISNLEINSNSMLELEDANLKKEDLRLDIESYYTLSNTCSKTFIQDFITIEVHRTSLVYKQRIIQFCVCAEYVNEMMVDLYERLSILLLNIDPSRRNNLTDRSSTVTQSSIIARRCKEIYKMYDYKIAGVTEYQEIIRLNRRMATVMKEADFLRLPADYEKKYKVIYKLLDIMLENADKYTAMNPLHFLVNKMREHKSDVKQHYNNLMEKCSSNASKFDELDSKYQFGYNHVQFGQLIKHIACRFDKYNQLFQTFHERYEHIKYLINVAWQSK